MAVNEKVVYATAHTTHAGVMYKPGDVMSGRAPEHAIRGALEQGVASDQQSKGEAAKRAEMARQSDVATMQRERVEPRDHNRR